LLKIAPKIIKKSWTERGKGISVKRDGIEDE
jgi:hypothetical protein